MPPSPPFNTTGVAPRLGLWDAVSIIIGIVVGTAIFRAPPDVFANSPSAAWAMVLWLVAGALSWCGGVCYAELATTYPRDGGDYVYLTRAFGPWCGFLFGWVQLTTVISGNIAIMAYAFADYGLPLFPTLKEHAVWVTMAPVVALSALNAVGVLAGKSAQNLLTVGKVVGLAALVLVGLLAAESKPLFDDAQDQGQAAGGIDGLSTGSIGLALVFVLYAYGGWAHAAYVAAEVRDQRRNLPRALVLGIAGVTLIYLAVNVTYLHVLGFAAARQTPTPAADVMQNAIGPWGGRAISVLVMLSALGAINGMILTGTRIYAAWGADYSTIRWLGAWNRRTGAPMTAIALQAVIAILLILLVGTQTGRNSFDATIGAVGLEGLPWKAYHGGFAALVAGSAPVYWILCLATGISIFVLRTCDRTIDRPFSMPLFPLPAVLFCATCVYMLQASLTYARWLSLIGFVPLAVGGVAWLFMRSHRSIPEQ
jgi:amino acid transporter